MTDASKIYRGVKHGATLLAVRDRQCSEPIPDEFLPQFEAAGLVVDDGDHQVILYSAGKKYGAVWGPSVDGAWFANLGGADAVRVESRDAGLRHVLAAKAVAS